MAERKAKAKTVANTTVNLNAMMKDARDELQNSKDRAMYAAAQCYIIWTETQSTVGKAWFDDKVKQANEVIDAHNKGLEKGRKEVAAYKADSLDPKHEALYEGNDTEALKLKSEAIARINALGKLMDEKRAPKNKVKIEKPKMGSEFAMVVKLVFGFHDSSQASLVSRYASVCEFIHGKCTSGTPVDVPSIVAVLEAAGGFEVSLRHQVKAKKVSKSGGNADDVKTLTAKAKEENEAAVKVMSPLSTFAIPVKTKADGYAVFLARTDGDTVEIVGEAPVTAAQITKMVSSFEPPAISADPAAEFVHRVLNLGTLVGGVVGKPVDGKKERKLVMRPGDDGKTQLLVSQQNGTANVVVHAAPHETTKIGNVPVMVALSHVHLGSLTQRLGDALYRRFTALEPDAAPRTASGVQAESVLGWHLQNRALVEANGAARKETLFWSKVGLNSVHKTVDVEALKVDARLIVSRDVLVQFWDAGLCHVDPNKVAKKPKVASLKYEDGMLVLDMPAKDDAELAVDCAVEAEVGAGVSLDFRPGDLAALVEKLMGLMVDKFVFEFDEGGLLAVSWEDQLGTYSIFQPTVMDGGQLNPKRLDKAGPMSAVNILATLAAKKPAAKVNRVAVDQIVAAPAKRAPTKKVKAA
jgi:hypothetical protein